MISVRIPSVSSLVLLCAAALGLGGGVGNPALTAIDILVLPDDAAHEKAIAANAFIRAENNPGSFILGEGCVPHITLVQAYVETGQLDALFAKLKETVTLEEVGELRATRYGHSPAGENEFTSELLEVAGTPALKKLHEKILDLVYPAYARSGGTEAAFAKNCGMVAIGESTRSYVETFREKSSGAYYYPHVTLGVVTGSFRDESLKDRVPPGFSIQAKGIAVYRLGDKGTAQEPLFLIAGSGAQTAAAR
jgi:hypothetical protein